MLYAPFALRSVTQPFTPRGPSPRSFKLTRFSIDETELSIRAPRHRAGSNEENISPRRSYQLNNLDSYMSAYRTGKDAWRSITLMRKVWNFYGPWLTGTQATVTMNLSLLKPRDLRSGVSFFHPRAFEKSVADLLTFTWVDDISILDGSQQDWFAPINWQVQTTFPCPAAIFDLQPNPLVNSDDPRRYLLFPIGDQRLVALTMTLRRNRIWLKGNAQPESTDEWIDINPLSDLANEVINSVRVNLSPQVKAQQSKALEGLADRSLTTTFPPLKWGGHPNSCISHSQ